MPKRPDRPLRSSEIRAKRGKPRKSKRGELDDLRAANIAQDAYLERLRPLTNLDPGYGTFTPTLAFTTPGTSSFTYTQRSGIYTRFGPKVDVFMKLDFTPTLGTASGPLLITGFPYEVEETGGGYIAFISGAFSFGTYTMLTSLVADVSGVPTGYLYLFGPSGTALIEPSRLTNGSPHTLYIGASYLAPDG